LTIFSHIDLHSHSNISDGLLSPSALVQHAAEQGLRVLALTDHDDTAGLDEARQAADPCWPPYQGRRHGGQSG